MKELMPVEFSHVESHDAKRRARILVVDDDVTVGDLLREALDSYEVQVANDPLEGLELVHWEEYDLLIVDLAMPWLSGTELIRMVRAPHAGRRVPIIIISAYDRLEA